MTLSYIPLSATNAEAYSRELYHVGRPRPKRNASDVTTHWYGWYVKPGSPTQAVLEVDLADGIPNDNASTTAEIQQALTAAGVIGQARADVVQEVIATRGARARVTNLIPPAWKTAALTRAQAEAQGYIVS